MAIGQKAAGLRRQAIHPLPFYLYFKNTNKDKQEYRAQGWTPLPC
jgi:hypothetical protein